MKKQTDKEIQIETSVPQAPDPDIVEIQQLALQAEDDDISSDEKRDKILEKRNDKLIDLFFKALVEKGLSEKVSNKHADNVYLFINTFMLFREGYTMEEGDCCLNDFFGYFYVRKCLWSNPKNLKTTAVSIQKFYKCMADKGLIPLKTCEKICNIIKKRLPDWEEECRLYNDHDENWDPWKYAPF
ncbi:MAG: hypothetical protein IJ228_12540 [Succinivibrio sp.]|nr:hypothetical protein [Succinivibrio sp.]